VLVNIYKEGVLNFQHRPIPSHDQLEGAKKHQENRKLIR